MQTALITATEAWLRHLDLQAGLHLRSFIGGEQGVAGGVIGPDLLGLGPLSLLAEQDNGSSFRYSKATCLVEGIQATAFSATLHRLR